MGIKVGMSRCEEPILLRYSSSSVNELGDPEAAKCSESMSFFRIIFTDFGGFGHIFSKCISAYRALGAM